MEINGVDIEKTNSFEEFKQKTGYSTDKALNVLKEKLRELKGLK